MAKITLVFHDGSEYNGKESTMIGGKQLRDVMTNDKVFGKVVRCKTLHVSGKQKRFRRWRNLDGKMTAITIALWTMAGAWFGLFLWIHVIYHQIVPE
jgi:hypothetical protein